jgi:hypothetical protein
MDIITLFILSKNMNFKTKLITFAKDQIKQILATKTPDNFSELLKPDTFQFNFQRQSYKLEIKERYSGTIKCWIVGIQLVGNSKPSYYFKVYVMPRYVKDDEIFWIPTNLRYGKSLSCFYLGIGESFKSN